MRAGAASLSIAMIAAAAAGVFQLRPFEPAFHQWAFAVAAALAGVFLLVQGVVGLRPRSAPERFAALGALGGALVCAAMVSASFAVGPPHALPGSPGQVTPVRPGASVLVQFPPITEQQLRDGAAPDSISVLTRGAREDLPPGATLKVGQYVLRADIGPIALVRATTPNGKPVTITQPEGATFVSPYLLFPGRSGDQRLDLLAVPPVHRTVNVTYYPSYHDEARHIDITRPFVLVQVAEENGASLFRGATISGKPVQGGGLRLTFLLGQYPNVIVSSAPATLPYWLGVLMLAAGLLGYIWCVVQERPAAPA
jgi:hypothetical protein